MTRNQKAFLDMIAVSEIGKRLLSVSADGYDVIVGSTWSKPILFNDFIDHPRVLNKRIKPASTAAGRYQILMRIFDAYKRQLKLPDFSPDSQDKIALQLIKECRALDDIEAGNFDDAVHKCRSRWASLPNAGYGQHENKIEMLREVFVLAGGRLSEGVV